MMLDFLGGMVLVAVIVLNVSALITALAVSGRTKLLLAGAVGLWTGLQYALAAAGVFASEFAATVPVVGLMVALPLAVVAVASAWSRDVRTALLELPLPLLVGLNVSRVFGAFFLFLAAAGRLAGPFPQSAGWGDVVSGFAAIPVAVMAVRGAASRAMIGGWNLFGAADLVVAVSLGVISAAGPLRLIEAGAGSSAVLSLPWSLIPTVLVPFYLVVHGIVHAKLRAAPRGAVVPGAA